MAQNDGIKLIATYSQEEFNMWNINNNFLLLRGFSDIHTYVLDYIFINPVFVQSPGSICKWEEQTIIWSLKCFHSNDRVFGMLLNTLHFLWDTLPCLKTQKWSAKWTHWPTVYCPATLMRSLPASCRAPYVQVNFSTTQRHLCRLVSVLQDGREEMPDTQKTIFICIVTTHKSSQQTQTQFSMLVTEAGKSYKKQ